MANGEGWARDVVQTTLARREKEGEEGLSIDELQEACGVGRGDLEEAIALLMAEGVVAHDGAVYEFVPPEERAPAVPVEELDPDDPDRLEAEEAARAAASAIPSGVQQIPAAGWSPERPMHVQMAADGAMVRLTRGMVGALEDDALGKLIKAAVEEHDGGDELRIAIK